MQQRLANCFLNLFAHTTPTAIHVQHRSTLYFSAALRLGVAGRLSSGHWNRRLHAILRLGSKTASVFMPLSFFPFSWHSWNWGDGKNQGHCITYHPLKRSTCWILHEPKSKLFIRLINLKGTVTDTSSMCQSTAQTTATIGAIRLKPVFGTPFRSLTCTAGVQGLGHLPLPFQAY